MAVDGLLNSPTPFANTGGEVRRGLLVMLKGSNFALFDMGALVISASMDVAARDCLLPAEGLDTDSAVGLGCRTAPVLVTVTFRGCATDSGAPSPAP